MEHLKIFFAWLKTICSLNKKLSVQDLQIREANYLTKKFNAQVDFLLFRSNKAMRRKWNRMLTNKRSPFYIGDDLQAL